MVIMDGMDSDVYIVNVDDRSNPTSELPPYVCHFEYENFIIEHAEFGDGYNVKGHLYVANSNEWVDFGEIQGAKGDPGDPGIDAINIVFSPAELVFDADENGNLKQAEKSAEVKVFRGNKQLTYLTDWDFPSVGKQTGDNCKGVITDDRSGLNEQKREFATSRRDVHSLEEAVRGADVFLGLSKGNVLTQDMVRSMAPR